MKRTRTVQVGQRSNKALLFTSHVVVSGSDPHLPAESQPVFRTDAIDFEIIPEPSRKKQRMGSFSARGTTNNRSGPETFDEVVPKHPPVGFEERVDSIGKRFWVMCELLRVLHRFRQNLFSARGYSPSFSLAERLLAAHIPASHPTKIHFFLPIISYRSKRRLEF